MTCRAALRLLRDLADRELSTDDASRVEEHCAVCRDCGGRLEAERDLKRTVRERFRPGPAPAGLAGSIARRVREDAGNSPPWRIQWSRPPVLHAAAAALLLGAAAGLWSFLAPSRAPNRPASAMVAELVDDHIRYLGVKDPAEVATADRGEAERWFTSRLGGPVALPRFAGDQARLLGGRLCYVLDRRVALLFYECEGRRMSLFVMGSEGLPESPSPERTEELERAVEEAKGYGVTCWTKEGRMYALVADMGRAGLARLVSSAYRE